MRRSHVTKSHHHQGVDRVGEGLVVSGRAVQDGLVQRRSRCLRSDFVLGVQWHPEADEESLVVGALVAEAGRQMRRQVAPAAG